MFNVSHLINLQNACDSSFSNNQKHQQPLTPNPSPELPKGTLDLTYPTPPPSSSWVLAMCRTPGDDDVFELARQSQRSRTVSNDQQVTEFTVGKGSTETVHICTDVRRRRPQELGERVAVEDRSSWDNRDHETRSASTAIPQHASHRFYQGQERATASDMLTASSSWVCSARNDGVETAHQQHHRYYQSIGMGRRAPIAKLAEQAGMINIPATTSYSSAHSSLSSSSSSFPRGSAWPPSSLSTVPSSRIHIDNSTNNIDTNSTSTDPWNHYYYNYHHLFRHQAQANANNHAAPSVVSFQNHQHCYTQLSSDGYQPVAHLNPLKSSSTMLMMASGGPPPTPKFPYSSSSSSSSSSANNTSSSSSASIRLPPISFLHQQIRLLQQQDQTSVSIPHPQTLSASPHGRTSSPNRPPISPNPPSTIRSLPSFDFSIASLLSNDVQPADTSSSTTGFERSMSITSNSAMAVDDRPRSITPIPATSAFRDPSPHNIHQHDHTSDHLTSNSPAPPPYAPAASGSVDTTAQKPSEQIDHSQQQLTVPSKKRSRSTSSSSSSSSSSSTTTSTKRVRQESPHAPRPRPSTTSTSPPPHSNDSRHASPSASTSSRLYACDWPGCTMAFARRQNMQCHMTSHTGNGRTRVRWRDAAQGLGENRTCIDMRGLCIRWIMGGGREGGGIQCKLA
ncbi:hypothetical protein BC829DRAFT_439634 [Chytridium lagenaria]|nr:hypothetical protein BC829DRAFT_439634 [Chytridium lagenaria]